MNKIMACVAITLLIAATAGAQLERTVMEQTPAGVAGTVQHREGAAAPPPAPTLRADYLTGQRSIDVVIYNSCGIAPDGHYAGTENGSANYPAVVENLAADGSVNWAFESNRAGFAHVHRGGALVENEAILGATVYGNGDGESWAWSHDLPNCTARCITQTADGSVVVVGVNKAESGEIFCYDGFTGDLLSSYELPAGGWTRVMDITEDGSLVASRGNMLHVIETATGTALMNQNANASCDVIAISPDGHWLVAGWTSMEVYERAGDRYEFRWANRRVAGAYACFARVNSAGDIVCGINTGTYNQTYVYMVNAGDTDHDGILYEGPVGDGTVQQVIKSIYFGDGSDLAVLGNWGDAQGTTPEIMVLEFGNVRPVASLDTRGSIYAVDGHVDGGGGLELVACGKQTHANEFGNGGDYYIMYIPNDITGVGDDETPAASRIELAGAYPNPFNPLTRVQFTLDRARNVKLTVFDLNGRRIAELADGVYASGEQTVIWNGRDLAGRDAPSGNYVVSLETENERHTAKMTLVR